MEGNSLIGSHRSATVRVIFLPQGHFTTNKGPIFTEGLGVGEEVEFDPVLNSIVVLFPIGRHLSFGAPVED